MMTTWTMASLNAVRTWGAFYKKVLMFALNLNFSSTIDYLQSF